MAAADLTAARLRELLSYDPDTGIFTWRKSGKGRNTGVPAGCFDKSNGYVAIYIDYQKNYAHRLAWLYANGCWPDGEIDHRDGVRTNNRLMNLRVVTRVVNMQNRRTANSVSASGLLGAYRKRDRWVSHLRVNGAIVRLGSFPTAEAAHAAYVAAKRLHHAGCTI